MLFLNHPKLKRPKTWINKERLALNLDCNNYNPYSLHCFFLDLLIYEKEVVGFYSVKGLEKRENIIGQWCSDLEIIIIDSSLRGHIKYETLLHELFHVFFHDEDDGRTRICEQVRDPVERRADDSAIHMLQWYKKNKEHYAELKISFNVCIKKMPIKRLYKFINGASLL